MFLKSNFRSKWPLLRKMLEYPSEKLKLHVYSLIKGCRKFTGGYFPCGRLTEPLQAMLKMSWHANHKAVLFLSLLENQTCPSIHWLIYHPCESRRKKRY